MTSQVSRGEEKLFATIRRKTLALGIAALVAGALLIVYLMKRDEWVVANRREAPSLDEIETPADESFEVGTLKRFDNGEVPVLVLEDGNGKELMFLCYENCDPVDKAPDSYVGKKIRVFWIATSDEGEEEMAASPLPHSEGAQKLEDRIAVRVEVVGG